MFFKKYNLCENKLSEQLSDDNPYKKKLIQMETPTTKHPIYTGLVWGLLIYSWIFFVVLFYKQINQSYLYNIKMIISACNIIFVTFSVWMCYKKDYLIGINPIYRRNSYIIFIIVIIFSFLIESTDSGTMTQTEILKTFCFLCTINPKSYIALAIIAYTTLGVASSYYSCPYELYRGFYSVNQTYKAYPNERKFINKCMWPCYIYLLAYFPLVYTAFNTSTNDFGDKIKLFSIVGIFGIIPLCTATFLGKKYDKYFEQATKFQ